MFYSILEFCRLLHLNFFFFQILKEDCESDEYRSLVVFLSQICIFVFILLYSGDRARSITRLLLCVNATKKTTTTTGV